MNSLYNAISVRRQSFFQMKARRCHELEEAGQLIPLIRKIRHDHPAMSAREMYLRIRPESMGRDKFEVFCFTHGFRVAQTRNYRITTDSRGVERFPNLIRDFELTGINQVFVSDITYYYMTGRFYYITLIMDLFNREVVGYSVSSSLRTEGTTLEALAMAAANRWKKALRGCIIHSDGGGQYYKPRVQDIDR